MLTFETITEIDSKNFESIIRIYQESFPENQRLPLNIVIQRTKTNEHQIIGGISENQLVLMSILHPLKGTDFILLTYLATDKQVRGKGIGTQYFNHLLNWANNQHKYLILEVEDSNFGELQDRNNKISRLNFYAKLGAMELKNVNYLLPPLIGNKPTEMKLLLIPKYPEDFLRGNLVKEIIQQIYQDVYLRKPNDPFLKTFMTQIETSIPLVSLQVFNI